MVVGASWTTWLMGAGSTPGGSRRPSSAATRAFVVGFQTSGPIRCSLWGWLQSSKAGPASLESAAVLTQVRTWIMIGAKAITTVTTPLGHCQRVPGWAGIAPLVVKPIWTFCCPSSGFCVFIVLFFLNTRLYESVKGHVGDVEPLGYLPKAFLRAEVCGEGGVLLIRVRQHPRSLASVAGQLGLEGARRRFGCGRRLRWLGYLARGRDGLLGGLLCLPLRDVRRHYGLVLRFPGFTRRFGLPFRLSFLPDALVIGLAGLVSIHVFGSVRGGALSRRLQEYVTCYDL